MNRGILSTFPLFALALWVSIFCAGALPGILFPVLGLACMAAAVPILCTESPCWKQAGLVLSLLGLGLLIGGLRVPETTGRHRYARFFPHCTAYTGIPPERVGEFRGILSADSTALPGSADSWTRYPVKLEQVLSVDGQQQASARGFVLVWIRNGQMAFQGQEIVVHAAMDHSREPGRFAYLSWAEAHQLQAGVFRRRIYSFRAEVFSAIQAKLQRLDSPVSSLLEALLLGRREELPISLYEQFRTSGSLHLLALSGLHLGILYLLLCLLFRFLRDRRLRRLTAGVLLLGYVLLVGWRPSLERAAVMLVIAALGYTLDREVQSLSLLGLAAAVLLLVHPHYAFDLSFQLSFVSLAAILLLGPYLYSLWQPFLPAFLGWPLGISLSAQIGTAPLGLYHFGAIYPVGVAAAMLLIPLVTIFLGAGVLFVGSSFLPIPLSGWIGQGLALVYRSIVFFLDIFSRVPGLHAPWRSLYWLFLLILLIPLPIELWMQRRIRSC